MRYRLSVFFSLIVALMGMTRVSPARAVDEAKLGAALREPGLQKQILDFGLDDPAVAAARCPAMELSPDLSNIKVNAQFELDEKGRFSDGLFIQGFDAKGCGFAARVNVLVLVRTQAPKVVMEHLVPGASLADPLLQRDIRGQLFTLVTGLTAADEPDCQTRYVRDTTVTQRDTQPAPGLNRVEWQERWTIHTCTKQVRVGVTFVPDSTGTGFVIGSKRPDMKGIEVTPLP